MIYLFIYLLIYLCYKGRILLRVVLQFPFITYECIMAIVGFFKKNLYRILFNGYIIFCAMHEVPLI